MLLLSLFLFSPPLISYCQNNATVPSVHVVSTLPPITGGTATTSPQSTLPPGPKRIVRTFKKQQKTVQVTVGIAAAEATETSNIGWSVTGGAVSLALELLHKQNLLLDVDFRLLSHYVPHLL